MGVLVLAGTCLPFAAYVAIEAISSNTSPAVGHLKVRNDTDRDVYIYVADAWEAAASMPPHRTITLELHPRDGLKFTTITIDGPVHRVCLWSDVQTHQPLVIDEDGAHCQDAGNTP